MLTVEDDRTTREALCQALRDEGFIVIAAADGGQGLWLATHQRPDLVITDLAMPVMRGEELCRRLRDDPSTLHIPIIVCSGDLPPEAHLCPAEGYLQKPVSLQRLISMAHTLVD